MSESNSWGDVRKPKNDNKKPIGQRPDGHKPDWQKSVSQKPDGQKPDNQKTESKPFINKNLNNKTEISNKTIKLSSLIKDGACVKCLNGSCRGGHPSNVDIPEDMIRFIKNPLNIKGFGDILKNVSFEFEGCSPRYTTCIFCMKGSCNNDKLQVTYQSQDITICYSRPNNNNMFIVGAHIDIQYVEKRKGVFDITCTPFYLNMVAKVLEDDEKSVSSEISNNSSNKTNSNQTFIKDNSNSNQVYNDKVHHEKVDDVKVDDVKVYDDQVYDDQVYNDKKNNDNINSNVKDSVFEDNSNTRLNNNSSDLNNTELLNDFNELSSKFNELLNSYEELNKRNKNIEDSNNNFVNEKKSYMNKIFSIENEIKHLNVENKKLIDEISLLKKNITSLNLEIEKERNLYRYNETMIHLSDNVIDQIMNTSSTYYRVV
jgi:hypothetical protein